MTKAEEILRKEITIIESSLQPDMQQMIRRSDALRAVEEAINNTHFCTELLCERNDWFNNFTVGKDYSFIGSDETTYVVIDDKKKFQVLPKYYFKELS